MFLKYYSIFFFYVKITIIWQLRQQHFVFVFNGFLNRVSLCRNCAENNNVISFNNCRRRPPGCVKNVRLATIENINSSGTTTGVVGRF